MADDRRPGDRLVEFVRHAHKGQVDKNGFNYFETHLMPVARSVPHELFYAALAHDILEDTATTADDLRSAGFTQHDIELIQLLTKPDDDYPGYLARIAKNPEAKIIKVMDVVNNLSRMNQIMDEKTRNSLIEKYLLALSVLTF